MSSLFYLQLVFLSLGVYCAEYYSKSTQTGVIARIDLIRSLKLTMKLLTDHITPKEQNAALAVVQFFNTRASDEYVEAFYSNTGQDEQTKIQHFLNGIVYNGNPNMPIWKSAEALSKLMKLKLEPNSNRNERTSPIADKVAVRHALELLGEDSWKSPSARSHINYVDVYNQYLNT